MVTMVITVTMVTPIYRRQITKKINYKIVKLQKNGGGMNIHPLAFAKIYFFILNNTNLVLFRNAGAIIAIAMQTPGKFR